jgi:hypothetical protein
MQMDANQGTGTHAQHFETHVTVSSDGSMMQMIARVQCILAPVHGSCTSCENTTIFRLKHVLPKMWPKDTAERSHQHHLDNLTSAPVLQGCLSRAGLSPIGHGCVLHDRQHPVRIHQRMQAHKRGGKTPQLTSSFAQRLKISIEVFATIHLTVACCWQVDPCCSSAHMCPHHLLRSH